VKSLSATSEGRKEHFAPTHWSVILAAGTNASAPEVARAALARLCQTYWSPLYSFVRSRGYTVHDAQDLTQGFFAYMIAHESYARADRQKGKFRSFLLASMKNYLTDAADRARTLKRGGGLKFLSLDETLAGEAESLFQVQADRFVGTKEDWLFERNWGETLVAAALNRLASAYKSDGKANLFESLKIFLTIGSDPLPTYEQLSVRLWIPAPTLRSQVARLRRRFRDLLRAEVHRTVDTESQVDGELRELLRVLTTD
jgi:DNA-directed RNA polymerase specialized sigma24 family protein